jgi:hypothetical protein
MQFRKFVPFLMILTLSLAACSRAKSNADAAMNSMPTEEAIAASAMATHTPETMIDHATERMATATTDAMMSHSEDMMDTATPDAMMNESGDIMGTATPDAMMGETHAMTDTATSDDMMGQSEDMMGTPTAEINDAAMMAPDWFSASLVNVATQEIFSINDLAGKVILVEPMAQWCPTCLAQQKQVVKLHELIGMDSDLVSLSLDIDPNEDSAGLQSYIAKNSFSWMFAVAPAEVSNEIGNLYGNQYLNPPSAPMFIIDRHGEVHTLPFGIKSAEDLQKTIEPYLMDMG